MSRPHAQLLVYRFGSDAGFEGQLVGALERIESGGTMRVLDALFVQLEPETQELVAIDLHGKGRGGFVAPVLNFRLDPAARRKQTRKALESEAGEMLRELAKSLDPGTAVAAVLIEHLWAQGLDDAVARTGGTEVANEFVEEAGLTPDLLQGVAARR